MSAPKQKRPASGDKYLRQYAQAQALARRAQRRKKTPVVLMQGSE